MKYVSLFAGIGGFDLALNRQGHECVFVNEWDKYAAQTYEKNFSNQAGGEQPREEWQHERDNVHAESIRKEIYHSIRIDTRSITDIPTDDIPDHDLLVGGFPCQSFSIAGLRGGFSDTRGTLFFEIARILKNKRPTYLLLENVKGLLSHDNGRTFQTIMWTLDGLGYDTQWQVLNSKDFGVPQNRERVFIIGHLRGTTRPEVFPFTGSAGKDYEQITSTAIDANYWKGIDNHGQRTAIIIDDFYPDRVRTSTESPTLRSGRDGLKIGTLRTHKDGEGFREMKSGLAPTIPARAREDGSGQPVVMQVENPLKDKTEYGWHFEQNVYGADGITRSLKASEGSGNKPKVVIPVLTPDRVNKRQNGRRFKEDGDPAFTLTAQDRHGVYDGMKIRRLTPVECERLQGFPDNWTAGVSDTQRYKQLGNAVTVNVVEELVKRLSS
jgi:DNA (cytosine-5)-methyltransferase 1